MASSSNLSSKFFNSIYINRLQALNSKVSNFNDPTPNFLFSILFNDATLNKHPDKATLSFTSSNISSIIQFTDRPLRQSKTISSEDFLSLFNVDNSGFNSFAEDPPNGVLVHNKEQKTYEIKSIKRDGSEIKFEMLSVGEPEQVGEQTGKMSFFIDMTHGMRIPLLEAGVAAMIDQEEAVRLRADWADMDGTKRGVRPLQEEPLTVESAGAMQFPTWDDDGRSLGSFY